MHLVLLCIFSSLSFLSYFAAYYQLTRERREMLDSLTATEGTKINWRMMETVVQHADNLDFLVDHHEAGEYGQGTAVALLHTLTRTNIHKHLVIITIIFSYA